MAGTSSSNGNTMTMQWFTRRPQAYVNGRLKILLLPSLLWALLGLGQLSHAVEISASVDRDQIDKNSTFNLTIEVTENAKDTPDFSVLNLNFEILGTQQSTNTSLINGRFSSKTTWRLTLIPKQSGFIIIPSITYKNVQTSPIKIKVGQTTGSTATKPSEPLFLEATVDRSEVYVQEQIVLTLRIFHRAKLLNGDLSKIELQNAVLEQIGDQTSYQTTLKGINYGVYEIKYAIYPQASGELVVPSFTFNGSIAVNNRNSNQSMFSPFLNQGRRVRAVSEDITITIKPKPDSYPKGVAWLPAKDLKLSQSWSQDSQELTVGDPLTRTIEIQATGQTAVSIPALPELSDDRIKVYPDKSTSEDKLTADGIVGVRTESAAIVPTQAGTISLPEVKVTWWDTENDRLRETILKSQPLKVAANDAVKAPEQVTPLQAPVQDPGQALSMNLPNSSTDATKPSGNAIWKLLTALMSILWLITLFFAWLFYAQRKTPETIKPTPEKPNLNLKAHLKAAVASCNSNDPEQAKSGVLTLASALANRPITSLAACKSVFLDSSINRELEVLEAALYQTKVMSWEGTQLAGALRQHINSRKQQTGKGDSSALAPLNPTA